MHIASIDIEAFFSYFGQLNGAYCRGTR